MNAKSIIGIRADWTCFECKRQERTHQLAIPGQPPDPPAGWIVDGDRVLCNEHDSNRLKYARVLATRRAA